MPMMNYLIPKNGILNLVVSRIGNWDLIAIIGPLSLISTAFWFLKRRLCKLYLSPNTNAKRIGDIFCLLCIDNTYYFDARTFTVHYQKCTENKFLHIDDSIWALILNSMELITTLSMITVRLW